MQQYIACYYFGMREMDKDFASAKSFFRCIRKSVLYMEEGFQYD